MIFSPFIPVAYTLVSSLSIYGPKDTLVLKNWPNCPSGNLLTPQNTAFNGLSCQVRIYKFVII